jgi:hypothetical protein
VHVPDTQTLVPLHAVPAQHGSVGSPQASQMPAAPASPPVTQIAVAELHAVPVVQHGPLVVPHAVHLLFTHTSVAFVHAVPASAEQHTPPVAPQPVHVPLTQTFVPVQAVPVVQHGAPAPPHAAHEPPEHTSFAVLQARPVPTHR